MVTVALFVRVVQEIHSEHEDLDIGQTRNWLDDMAQIARKEFNARAKFVELAAYAVVFSLRARLVRTFARLRPAAGGLGEVNMNCKRWKACGSTAPRKFSRAEQKTRARVPNKRLSLRILSGVCALDTSDSFLDQLFLESDAEVVRLRS